MSTSGGADAVPTFDRHASVGALDQLACGVTGLAQLHRREVTERLAAIGAAGVVAD